MLTSVAALYKRIMDARAIADERARDDALAVLAREAGYQVRTVSRVLMQGTEHLGSYVASPVGEHVATISYDGADTAEQRLERNSEALVAALLAEVDRFANTSKNLTSP